MTRLDFTHRTKDEYRVWETANDVAFFGGKNLSEVIFWSTQTLV